ncbi:MAG TPA: type II toxin-antitoxin system HicA family toxin [Chloroflexota bacterium]|nr:type II toxin-antitoxin system HicA family toxin [Chloroflexota bacterium]
MPPKVREVLKRLERDGWELLRQQGSHRQYRKRGNPYVLTIAGRPSDELRPGTWSEIQRKAGWKR